MRAKTAVDDNSSLNRMAKDAGVIFGATSEEVVKALAERLNIQGSEIIVDIGSGVGDFVLPLSRLFPNTMIIGIEKIEEYVRISEKRRQEAATSAGKAVFVRQDVLDADFGIFDILYMYCPLTDENNFYERLSSKIAAGMKPGARLVCFGLDMSDKHVRKLFDPGSGMVAGYDIRQRIFLEDMSGRFEYKKFEIPEEICWHPNLVEVYTKLTGEENLSRANQMDRETIVKQWLSSMKAVGK